MQPTFYMGGYIVIELVCMKCHLGSGAAIHTGHGRPCKRHTWHTAHVALVTVRQTLRTSHVAQVTIDDVTFNQFGIRVTQYSC